MNLNLCGHKFSSVRFPFAARPLEISNFWSNISQKKLFFPNNRFDLLIKIKQVFLLKTNKNTILVNGSEIKGKILLFNSLHSDNISTQKMTKKIFMNQIPGTLSTVHQERLLSTLDLSWLPR